MTDQGWVNKDSPIQAQSKPVSQSRNLPMPIELNAWIKGHHRKATAAPAPIMTMPVD